jgi:hypothetical protein
MILLNRIRDGIIKNPVVWMLVALLAVAEHGNYERGRELTRVCELLGPHDVAVGTPRTAKEEIDNICISRSRRTDD